MYFYHGFRLTKANCSCVTSKMRNCTTNDNDNPAQVLLMITVTLCVLIGIAATTGNGLVFLALRSTKSLRTPTNFFIASLALADMFIGVIVIPLSVVGSLKRPAWFYTKLFDFILTQSFAASTFNLSAISFDRYLAITSPLRYPLKMNKQRSKNTIAILWLLSLSIATLSFIDFHWKYIVRLVVTILVFVIPFLTILYFYWRIFQEANRQRVVIRTQNRLRSVQIEFRGKNSLPEGLREHRAAVTIAIVIGIFALCWLPNLTMAILQVCLRTGNSCIQNTAFDTGWLVTMTIAFANSSLNPFIYAVRNSPFRRAFKKVILCGSCRHEDLHAGGSSDRIFDKNS